ncbi:hypothetical protein J31TS4_44740 [Paenibacillus sp. J31TS4]|uniref:hypothetical protein n=1 Tax=Paenibacillus sp. J31TS4 TaxID=2807195 RepID=UPI001B069DC7|nr:hypothetical protein [Paenibacillus sp. J31TS4]GIP41194.1 hypothetical protein J31TS4_44740 [Paenibacillus sp. J31TS4]
MKDVVRSERGNASFYLIWFIVISGFLLVFLFNVLNLFGKKEQAAIAAEQAAMAGTDVLLQAVYDGVEQFDFQTAEGIARTLLTGDTLSGRLSKAKQAYVSAGTPAPEARLKAFNKVLEEELSSTSPDVLGWKAALEESVRRKLDDAVDRELKGTVKTIINSNAGKLTRDSEVALDRGRVAVTAHAEYETRVFDTLIPFLKHDVPYKGYGPELKFMDELGWSIHDKKLAAFP